MGNTNFLGINVVSKALSLINHKKAKIDKQPERARNTANGPITTLYEIEPNQYDGLSFISHEKINVKFGG